MKRFLLLSLLLFSCWPALAQSGGNPSVPPITIQEADGSPRVQMPTKIVFPNGSLTITGKTATVAFSGGGGGGTPGGSDTEVQYNNAGAFGGIRGVTSDGTSLFISALNLQADQPTFLNDVAFVKNNISNVTDDGINLVNQTAAIAGGQQFSPGIRWTGNGWKTSSGGASQAMDAIVQLETVQGAAVPTSNLVISFQSNGTGYTPRFTFGNTGRLTVDESLVAASVASSIYTSALANSTYLQLTSGVSGAGVTLGVGGGGTNESLILTPKGTGVIEQRNGTNAQTLRVYNTYTDASNYERGFVGWTSNRFDITTENLGTGGSRAIGIRGKAGIYFSGDASTFHWLVNTSGHLLANADDAYNIGASGASRPANVNVGTSISIGTVDFTNAPLNIKANGAGLGFIISRSATEYTEFISGGIEKGLRGVGTVQFKIKNDGDIFFVVGGTELLRINATTGLIQFSGTSASFPALKRSSTGLQVRLADDTDFAPFYAATVLHKAYTVATLPSAASFEGAIAYVTDANATTRLATVAGGGSNKVIVYSDGTNWVIL